MVRIEHLRVLPLQEEAGRLLDAGRLLAATKVEKVALVRRRHVAHRLWLPSRIALQWHEAKRHVENAGGTVPAAIRRRLEMEVYH